MSIDVRTIDAGQVARILALEEGHFADVKAKEIGPAKLTKTLSAFANADGGEVYVGIVDGKSSGSHSWNGFGRPEDTNAHLQVFDELFPLGQFFSYELLTAEEFPGVVLKATILKAPDIRPASDGVVYVRRGAQSLPYASPERLEMLRRSKGLTTHERATVLAPLELVTNSETIIGFMLDVVPAADPEPWLRKQLLIDQDKPTVAGLVVFADEPQVVLPKASVKIYRYKTSDPEGSREALDRDPETVEGCVYSQIFTAVRRTREIVQDIPVLSDSGLEAVEYPVATLHEIITNALLHRDYALQDDVHVRVFDNRIEVESPGTLPAHVTASNILDERFARNPAIVRMLNKFPNAPNKDVGEGLNTAFAAMRALRLKEPVIAETGASVVVTIKHESLASPEEQIMEYLDAHDEIKNSQARKVTGIGSENRVKRIFQKMMSANLIERIPGRPQSQAAYRRSATEEGTGDGESGD